MQRGQFSQQYQNKDKFQRLTVVNAQSIIGSEKIQKQESIVIMLSINIGKLIEKLSLLVDIQLKINFCNLTLHKKTL